MTTATMASQTGSRTQLRMEASTPVDVLTALSAFPAPPNYIPTSLAASITTASTSSYFSPPREKDREVPPSSFNNRAGSRTAPRRQDSAASGLSVGSAHSSRSGKLSVLVDGRDVAYGREKEGKRDSGSASSTSSCLATGGGLPSPMSGQAYFTAPNSPLLPGMPGAGPSSGLAERVSSSSSLNTPSSAYPHSTSSGSAYPSSQPSSAYPHSPAYSYSNTGRFAYTSSYTPSSSSSPASVHSNAPAFNPTSAYAVPSARAALSMLSTPVSASASAGSSPSSAHDPISAVGMSPIQEKDERQRLRRQISVPPPSHRQKHRHKDGDSGSDIGSPPSVPLPPLPPTANFGETTPKPTQTQTPGTSATPRGPPSVKSLPSLRSRRSSKSVSAHGHGRKESGVSVMSGVSMTSAFSAAAPSLAEFGVATRHRIEAEVELDRDEDKRDSKDERRKGRARMPRMVPVPLRIDIPPSYAQEKERAQESQQRVAREIGSATSIDSANSLTSPFPREFGAERTVRERAAEGEKMNSPTASLFSIASAVTGLSAAQSLRTRVSGMLDGLANIPRTTSQSTSPSVTQPASRTSPCPNGGGKEEERIQRSHNLGLQPPSMSVQSTNGVGDTNGLFTTEDLRADPLLARAVTPLENGRNAPSPSPLELSSMGRTLRAMRADTSPLTGPSLAHMPPLSDAETDGNESDRLGAEAKLLPSLLGQFPTTPTMRTKPPPSSFPFPSSNSQLSAARTPTSASSSTSNGVSRTMSQSRRKPLPPDPCAMRTSVSSLGSSGSTESRCGASVTDGAMNAVRGRRKGGRDADGDGATSPDIAAMMCATPRPVLRSKSVSARSSRSSKSLSTRSSSVRSSVRNATRPSLPDERERLKALARVSAASSSSSASPSPMSSITHKELSARRSAGSAYAEAFGGIEDDGDASVDYGVAIARHRGAYDLSPSLLHVDGRLEGEVDEFGALRTGTDATDFYAEEAEAMLGNDDNGSPDGAEEGSDSDIDLHTPLPHILLRQGVLSPHSKLLASTSMGSLSVRSSFVGSGRDSIASYTTQASLGSVMTESRLFKDERNTEGRRRRHRDGKTLREGLGLTTGLGWSDSEDEDAPSPFTDRLSSLALSRKTSMASVQSSSSPKLQFFTRSTPSSAPKSRTPSTYSSRSNLKIFRSSRSPVPGAELHPLSKAHSSVSLTKMAAESNGKHTSPTLTSSSTTSAPFPPTPRDDMYEDSEGSLLSGSIGRIRAASGVSSTGARTPTVKSVKPTQSASQLRPRAMSSSKSVPPSRLPSTGTSTPRPLRLPALQQQRTSYSGTQENEVKLQPGQPAPNSGSLLGYNRNLHDRQRTERFVTPISASSQASPPGPLSPALSAKSAPSSFTTFGSRRAYGSMPVSSALHPPSGDVSSKYRDPSPSRLSAPNTGLGRPRTGTGMVYRLSSLPPTPSGSVVGRATAM